MAPYRPSAERLDVAAAASRIADLGFLAGPDLPDRPGPAHLLIALRDVPTLRHYDPERIDFWVTEGGRGSRQSLTRDSRVPLDTEVSWGMIQIVDRLHETNEYLTFGGHLSAARIGGATIVAISSPVPLLCRGGHSQLWDAGSEQLGAFFARIVAAVDVRPDLESRFAAVGPLVRYAAFIADVVARYRSCADLRDLNPRVYGLLLAEESLMRREHADAWKSASAILAGLSGI
ncbi:MAG TPA: hypothetical protein VFI34_10505 [Candidatus Limnocylindrales bacterium]|nr:hypothetical protein [Candidatus Limnocylindrales bacterium]